MKTNIFLAVFITATLSGTAQYAAIEKEILEYKNSQTIIANIRELIQVKLDSGKKEAAKDIYDYAIHVVEPKKNLVFYNYEKVSLSFLLGDYSYILHRIEDIQSGKITPGNLYKERDTTLIGTPGSDDLHKYLLDQIKAKITMLDSELDNRYADKGKNLLLKIYIRFYMPEEADPEFSAQRINELVKEFRSTYPESAYTNYVTNAVQKNISPKKFRYGIEMNFGLVQPKGNAAGVRSDDVTVSWNLNLNYKKWLVQLGFQTSESNLKKDLIVKNEVWAKDSSINLNRFNVTLGYMLVDGKRWGIYPTIGEHLSFAYPYYNGPTQSKKNKVFSSLTPAYGIKVLYKRYVQSYSTRKGGDAFAYTALNIEYANYNYKNNPQFNGRNLNFSISVMAHLAEISLLMPYYWGCRGNRNVKW